MQTKSIRNRTAVDKKEGLIPFTITHNIRLHYKETGMEAETLENCSESTSKSTLGSISAIVDKTEVVEERSSWTLKSRIGEFFF